MKTEYKPGDRRGYIIFGFAPKPRTGWTEKICDEFIDEIIKNFEVIYGFKPDTIDVPRDYVGKEIRTDVSIRSGAKPIGHYYAYKDTGSN